MNEVVNNLVLSIFPGIDLLGRAFEEEGFCVVRGPDLLWGGDIALFHPPDGVFDGVIGGPPCGPHSKLRTLNRKRNCNHQEDLIPEYARVVNEGEPDWFLMENGEFAYAPDCPAYSITEFKLNNRECPMPGQPYGPEQNRERRFWFGVRGGLAPSLRDYVEIASENPIWTAAVTASGVAKPGTEHQRGKRLPRLYGWSSWANLKKALRWMGLPKDFLDHTPFTLKGAHRVIGNGVPLPMGRAVAKAVRKALSAMSAPEARVRELKESG